MPVRVRLNQQHLHHSQLVSALQSSSTLWPTAAARLELAGATAKEAEEERRPSP